MPVGVEKAWVTTWIIYTKLDRNWRAISVSFGIKESFIKEMTIELGLKKIVRIAVSRVGGHSICGSWTSSISIIWEFVRNVRSWTLAQTYWIRNPGVGFSRLCLTSPPGDSDACSNLLTGAQNTVRFIQVLKFIVITLWEDALLFETLMLTLCQQISFSVLLSYAFWSYLPKVCLLALKKRLLFHYPLFKCCFLQEWFVLYLLINFFFVEVKI